MWEPLFGESQTKARQGSEEANDESSKWAIVSTRGASRIDLYSELHLLLSVEVSLIFSKCPLDCLRFGMVSYL